MMLSDKAIRDGLVNFLNNRSPKPSAIIEELRVHNGNAIADVVAVLKEPDTLNINASYWFTGRGIDNTTAVMESCLPMPYYDVVLTILWFPEPPFDIQTYNKEEDEYSCWRWLDPAE